MKKLLILLLCTAVLSACGSDDTEKQIEEITEVAQTSTTNEVIETITNATDGSTVSETVEEIYEIPEISAVEIPIIERRSKLLLIGDNLIFAEYGDSLAIMIYNAVTGEVAAEIPVPKGYGVEYNIVECEDCLCKVGISPYMPDDENKSRIIVIAEDFSYEIIDGEMPAASIDHYGRKIASQGMDIIETESGEVLVSGVDGEEFYEKEPMSYAFPVDENRFVYRNDGQLEIAGFGIYDFSSGKIQVVAEPTRLVPFGMSDGKIYSVKSVWAGDCGCDIYTTDTETLKTELFFSMKEKDGESYIHYDYFVMNDGKVYVAASWADKCVLYRVTADGAEKIYNFPESCYGFYDGIMTDGERLYAEYSEYDFGRGIIIVDLNML